MQKFWATLNLGWDNHIPEEIAEDWTRFKLELLELDKIEIPRCFMIPDPCRIELHGFADASEKAFGCVFYTRVTDLSTHHHGTILCAKSRVAQLKKQSIPRLELCAALLVSELSEKIIETLQLKVDAIYLWSDSEITLFRIKSEPHRYTTFVANRIAKIQESAGSSTWHHIDSMHNPADHVSRGLMPSALQTTTLWWRGPEFLTKPKSQWPKSSNRHLTTDLANLDIRDQPKTALPQIETTSQEIFTRFHSLFKLLRVVSYIRRFYHITKNKSSSYSSIHIDHAELKSSLIVLIKIAQQSRFADDIKTIKANKPLGIKDPLRVLSPFVDQDGILRVGGRLRNADIAYDSKHQIILKSTHILTKMIVHQEHHRFLHAGPQALLYNLRLQYWIIGGRNLCRTVVHQCIRCFQARPRIRHQIMGDLPVDRVNTSARPFITVGIDFCGPFISKTTIRSKVTIPCYVCLFVCFVTKAVHLELVMNLSTEAFIACLRRFIARRGLCAKIVSDNATNFIGARSELQNLKKLFASQDFHDSIYHYCPEHNIEWYTIPPRSPHFGGLWESAIKSAKYHMRRVIGKASFTVEEYYTLIAQVEACMNSRPLTAMSNDPHDMTALSPGHFLIGAPLTSLVEPVLLDLHTNRLSRYQSLQKLLQNFWKRWKVEYLTTLQHRNKWHRGQEPVKVGSLVLLHDENLIPLKWDLGRITEIHPGRDGIIRVVIVKTRRSTLKRATNKISILPIDDRSD